MVRPSIGGLKYFKNKVIVDCGAGSGRQSLWMARAGARFVFSLELSGAAQTIIKKVTERYQDKIFVIQGDLAHLPINKKFVGVDLIYCVNVIQHTQNPQKTLSELSLFLRPGSEFLFNIYLKRGGSLFNKFGPIIKENHEDVSQLFDQVNIPDDRHYYLPLKVNEARFPRVLAGHL